MWGNKIMTNFIRVRIDGLNTSKIINDLIDKNVYIEKLVIKQKYVVFNISEQDKLLLEKTCKRYHKNYKVIRSRGIRNLLKRVKYIYGTILASILSVAWAFSFDSYIFKINLSYVSEQCFDLSDVKNLLNKNNIVEGSKKNQFSVSEIQQMILSSQENIAGCSVTKNGGVLDIVVYPGITKNELNNNDIVSNYNAVITQLDVFAGKTDFKVGDLVKKNEVVIKNDNGASGVVRGKVYFSDYIIYNENQLVKRFTGEIYEDCSVCFFNKKLQKPLKIDKNLNYIEENCVFYLNKNFLIPISIIKTQYLFFEYENSIVKFENVEEKLKEDLYSQILKNIGNDRIVTNVTYSVVSENNLTRLDCFVECEMDIIS